MKDEVQDELLTRLKPRWWTKLVRFIKEAIEAPEDMLLRNPAFALVFSVPAALVFLIFGMQVVWGTPKVDDVIIFTVLIAIIPPGIFQYIRYKDINKIEERFPDFMLEMAELNRAGMTLPHALGVVAKGEYDALTPEIRRMDAMISWGIPFGQALQNFARRKKTLMIQRSVSMITQAERAGANIPDILESTAKYARGSKVIEDERRGSMFLYVVISYMAFFVFLLIVWILSTVFIPVMAEAGALAGPGVGFLAGFDPAIYTRLFFHAAVIQAFTSGLVAGKIGGGGITAGLKHSVILMIFAYVVFAFIR
ncbi:MAG: type II secretion system F family protein [Methanocellales archaeon]|nr:type II secretion system F family protein [Methanocellales archaeon]